MYLRNPIQSQTYKDIEYKQVIGDIIWKKLTQYNIQNVYILAIYHFGFFSGLVECTVSANNAHSAKVTEPIRFELNYS
jgi:hypothetical protein